MSTKRDKICAEILQVESNYVRALRTLEQEIRVPVMYVFFLSDFTPHISSINQKFSKLHLRIHIFLLSISSYSFTKIHKLTQAMMQSYVTLEPQGAIRTQDASQVEFHIWKHKNYSGSESKFAFGSTRGG